MLLAYNFHFTKINKYFTALEFLLFIDNKTGCKGDFIVYKQRNHLFKEHTAFYFTPITI